MRLPLVVSCVSCALGLLAPAPALAGRAVPLVAFSPGLWTVEVAAPGGGPAWRWLVDTGSTHTVLSTSAASRAGLPVEPGGRLLTPAGVIEAGAVELPPFRLGGWLQPARRVLVAPLAAIGRDPRLDGILGMDVLGGGPVVLDLAGGALLLGQERPAGAGQGEAVPARVHGGRLVVDVEVDGALRTMVLDSGAQVPVVFDAAPAGAGVTIGTVAGAQPARASRAELRVGDVSLGGVPTVRVPPPRARTGSDGLLPAAMFARVYLDPVRGDVRVVPRR
jgi:predicted aspartyl protease